uniref:Uncharacterized protein n=1 Tax=Salix viminalis TaxID=40686 RepID=A0A6N2MKT2_SALVM
MPGDSVLKILMQKVRSLDLSLSILERYLEEVNSKYGNIFKEIDKDLGEKDVLLEKIRSDVKSLDSSQEVIAKDVNDLISWKSLASTQLDGLLSDNLILRSKVERVLEKQKSMENKGIAVFLICLIFGTLAFVRLFVDLLLSVYMAFSVPRTELFLALLTIELHSYHFGNIVIIMVQHIKLSLEGGGWYDFVDDCKVSGKSGNLWGKGDVNLWKLWRFVSERRQGSLPDVNFSSMICGNSKNSMWGYKLTNTGIDSYKLSDLTRPCELFFPLLH